MVIATLVALIVAQRSLLRRTRRVFNVGLTVATAAGLIMLRGWASRGSRWPAT